MRRIFFSLVALLALTTAATAQLCGASNPNCIVPTRPPGTNDNTAASTAFVANAVSSALIVVGTTPVTNGVPNGILYDGAGGILQNNGPFLSTISNPTGNGQWSVGGTTVLGAILIGQGTTDDVCLENKNGVGVLCIPTGTTIAQFGTPSTATGSLALANAASAFLTTIQAGNAAAARTYTWPTNFGAAGSVLTDAAGNGTLSWAAGGGGGTPCTTTALSVQYNNAGAFGCVSKWTSDASDLIGSTSGRLQWNSDAYLFRDAAVGTLALGDSTTAAALRVYNTTDQNGTGVAPTNYERGVFDWTSNANTLTIATQAGGTGTARAILIKSDATGSFAINLATANGNVSMSSGGALQEVVTSNPAGIYVLSSSGQFDVHLNRVSSSVLGIGNGSGGAVNLYSGWLAWAGMARLDADFSATSNTTLANVTGSSHSLVLNLQTGRPYTFEIFLPMVTGATLGGIKIGLGGTATITNLIADGACVDGTTPISVTRVSTLTQMVANTNAGTTPKCTIWGTFEVNAAGTFTVQFAQNAANGTASTVKRGAYMFANDSPGQ